MARLITCPSGLSGRVRGFKAKEANILADRAALKRGLTYDNILSGCWLETADTGCYSWQKSGVPIDWAKALVCDRFWALLMIRAETYGDLYEFDVPCRKENCQKPIEWEVLTSDLPFKALPQSSREQLLAGENKFKTTLDDGKLCWFSLQTGAGEAAASQAMQDNRTEAMVAALATRIISIEGLEPQLELVGASEKARERALEKAKRKYLDDLEMREVLRLVELFEESDGGVETDLEVECQNCFALQKVGLPFGVDFFLPRARKSAKSQG
jgi:hypothetical protein